MSAGYKSAIFFQTKKQGKFSVIWYECRLDGSIAIHPSILLGYFPIPVFISTDSTESLVLRVLGDEIQLSTPAKRHKRRERDIRDRERDIRNRERDIRDREEDIQDRKGRRGSFLFNISFFFFFFHEKRETSEN